MLCLLQGYPGRLSYDCKCYRTDSDSITQIIYQSFDNGLIYLEVLIYPEPNISIQSTLELGYLGALSHVNILRHRLYT